MPSRMPSKQAATTKPVARAAPMNRPAATQRSGIRTSAQRTSANSHPVHDPHGDGQIGELEEKLSGLKLTVESLERERDFYYGKLRDIEILCQGHSAENENGGGGEEKGGLIDKILNILYATEEGFAVPEDGREEDQLVPEGQDEY